MMDQKIDALLLSLDDELERKCCALRLRRRETAFRRLFFCFCGLFLLLPFLLIFVGINLVTVCVPVFLFLGAALVALLPVILGDEPGGLVQ